MSPQANRPGAGDFTGRQKAQANKDALKEQAERRTEMAMATAVETEEQQHGVFDPQTQERLDKLPEALDVVEEEERPRMMTPRLDRSTEPVYTGKEPVEEQLPPPPPSRGRPQSVDAVRPMRSVIRVDADIENMTFGMRNGEPNNFNFREGFAYEVDTVLADHLADRGLVRQWIR
jgi:hypothetical protein